MYSIPKVGSPGATDTNDSATDVSGLSKRVVTLLKKRSYDEASDQLRAMPRSPLNRETLGVCLLRSGRVDEALTLFRSLAMQPGTTILRKDARDSLRINFATSLLLSGIASGALEVLDELLDRKHPAATQLRGAVQRWASGLSFWRRLDWKFSRIDPPGSSVPIDFAPGVFPFPIFSDVTQASEMSTIPLPGGSHVAA